MDVDEEHATAPTNDCWSCRSSEATTPLYAGTEFHVSRAVLDDLSKRFGSTGTVARVSHKRYGWELILMLLGPERLQTIHEVANKGVATMLKKMVSTADVLYVVLQHSRQIYNLRAIAASSRGPERHEFQNYCNAMFAKLHRAYRINAQPWGRSRKRVQGLSQTATSSPPTSHEVVVQRGSCSRSTRKRSPKDYLVDSSSDEEDVTQTDIFLHQSVSNNSAVSEKSLTRMMNNSALKKEVAQVMLIAQSLAEETRNYKTFVDGDDNFNLIHQDGRDLHLSLDLVNEFYTERWSVKDNVSGWRCRHCSWVCSEENGMRWHVAKKHFFGAMGIEEGFSASTEVDVTASNSVSANQEAGGKRSSEREPSVMEIQDSSDDEEAKSESSDLLSSGAAKLAQQAIVVSMPKQIVLTTLRSDLLSNVNIIISQIKLSTYLPYCS